MGMKLYEESDIQNLANIIREKNGTSETYSISQMDNAVEELNNFSGDYNDLTNKPTLGTASPKDVASSGDASATQVVMGNDSRLTDRRGSTWGQINGTLSNQTDLNNSINSLQGQIDTFTALPDGSTTGDAELTNIRVDSTGHTYPTAGDAVRAIDAQVNDMKTGFDGVVYPSPAAMVQGCDNRLQGEIDFQGTILSFANAENGFVNIYGQMVSDGIRKHIEIQVNKGDTVTVKASGRSTGCSIIAYKNQNNEYAPLVNSRSADVEEYTYTSTITGQATLVISFDSTIFYAAKIDTHEITKVYDYTDQQIAEVEQEISGIKGFSITLDFTGTKTTYDSSVYAKAGESYTMVNNNDLTVVVFVIGHQESGEYIVLQPYSTGVFNAQYNGYLRFYKSGGAAGEYVIEFKSSVETGVIIKVFECTPTSGFYNALNAIAAEDPDINKVLYVHEGTYDLFTEAGGVTFANTITNYNQWANYSVFIPKNTRVVGVGKVILKMEIDVSALDSSSQAPNSLSPLNAQFGCSIENIEIQGSCCRYCIHIEGNGQTKYNEQTFNIKNVVARFTGSTYGFGSAIGIGINKGCTLNVDDSILETEKGWGIGGHLNNGAAIMNVNNSVLNGVRQSFMMQNHPNAQSPDSIFSLKNCYAPTVHVANNESTVFNAMQFNFYRTDTTLTKDENVGTIIHHDYDCTVTEDF